MRKTTLFLLLVVSVLTIAGLVFYTVLSKEPVALGTGLNGAAPLGVPVPLEVTQLILPDGHPEFPLNTAWLVVPGEVLPIEVPVPLEIPASWEGSYAMRVEGNTAYYDYTATTAKPERIFSITALNEVEWQAVQNEPHGEAIFAYSGITWVFNPALENPYDGEHADQFSQLVGEAYWVAQSLEGFFTPQITRETTLPVLQTYFDALRGGNYLEAARLFGGDLEVLAGNNPDIDPGDRGALFERACTVNGFACSLEIGEIITVEQVSPTAIQYTLTFLNPDGTPLETGACCEAYPATTSLQQEFIFHVAYQDGRFLVMELPVYVP